MIFTPEDRRIVTVEAAVVKDVVEDAQVEADPLPGRGIRGQAIGRAAVARSSAAPAGCRPRYDGLRVAREPCRDRGRRVGSGTLFRVAALHLLSRGLPRPCRLVSRRAGGTDCPR